MKQARNVCKVIIYLLGPLEGTSHGFMVAAGPLPILARVFLEAGENKMVAWCAAARLALESKGIHV